jgi:hypothetical protein
VNIFDFIGDILHHKQGGLVNNIDDESAYNAYMVNRWISMYSPQLATIINMTTNRYYSVFESKKDHYNFLLSITPRVKQYRINYIKKQSKKSESDEAINILAKTLELSKREIRYYIEQGNIDIERIKKAWQ